MALEKTHSTGTLYGIGGGVAADVRIYVHKTKKSATASRTRKREIALSNEDGEVDFYVPRNSVVIFSGEFVIGEIDFSADSGIARTVPDDDEATLESLGAAVSLVRSFVDPLIGERKSF